MEEGKMSFSDIAVLDHFYDPTVLQVKEDDELTPIQEFYNKTSILVTGGTGFLGKLLVEKLLRSCPTVSTIYLLVRDKKGKDLQTRMDEMLSDVIFARLKKESSKFKHKVIGISGDCSLPGLGLSIQDRQLLIQEVSVIFHAAATVRFDENLKIAIAINVRSTQDLIKLSREMMKLKSFVHVSTAYSNCAIYPAAIEEKFHAVPFDTLKLMNIAESLPEDTMANITPALLGKWPNTYAFTKALAEDLIRLEGQGLPLGVHRPSIVTSTYREPLKAWINNYYGPTGVLAGAGTGLIRIIHCNPNVNANIIPADMVVNSLIATGWEVGRTYAKTMEQKQNFDIPIYNFESNTENPLTWRQYTDYSWGNGINVPCLKSIWYYSFKMEKNIFLYYFMTLFLHYLPALLIDGVLFCIGRKPSMINVYKKIQKFTMVIAYFANRDFKFESHRIRSMLETMCKRDRELFFCDVKKLNWTEYFHDYPKGARVFLVKDPLDTLEEAKIKQNRLYYAHQLVKALLAVILIRILWAILSTAYSFF